MLAALAQNRAKQKPAHTINERKADDSRISRLLDQ